MFQFYIRKICKKLSNPIYHWINDSCNCFLNRFLQFIMQGIRTVLLHALLFVENRSCFRCPVSSVLHISRADCIIWPIFCMLKISTSAKNLLLSVIPWQNVQTPRDHILVNVNLDTLELALSIVQVKITTISLHNAPMTDI